MAARTAYGRAQEIPCAVEGCDDGGYKTRGYCKRHYARLRRQGVVGEAEREAAAPYRGSSCSVAGCDRPARSRGYCRGHYKRWRTWGDPLGGRPVIPATSRFWAKVEKNGAVSTARPGLGPCWVWVAGRTAQGYGLFHPSKTQSVLAHRWAYQQAGNEIPEGMVLDHLCRNRRCVNPLHLEPVTDQENLRRGAGYGLRNGMRRSCVNGHSYTPENSYYSPAGELRCRQCARDRDKRRTR